MENGSDSENNDLKSLESKPAKQEDPSYKSEAGWMSIFDDIDSGIFVYVSDPRTHELLYGNSAIKGKYGPDVLGKTCFQALYGLAQPCSYCDVSDLLAGPPYASKIRNFFNPKLGRWFKNVIRVIRWPDGRIVRYEMAIDIHARKEAKNVLRHRLIYEKILSDISSRAVLVDNIFRFLDDCMQVLRKALKVSHVHLFRYHSETDSLDSMIEWVRENEIPQKDNFQNLPAKTIPWWIQQLKAGEILSFANIEDIPDEPQKAILRFQNIKSVLAIPLRVMSAFYGFIQLDETRSLRTWKPEEANFLKTAMQVIGKTIEVHQTQRALRQSQDRYRALVDDMPAMVCRFLPDGTLTFVNDLYCRYFNKNASELIGEIFFQFIPEQDRSKVREHYTGLNPDHPLVIYEHPTTLADGGIRWHEWTDRAIFNEQGLVMEYQSIGRDITAQKLADQEKERLQKQLLQAQKLEAIGTLAGGIAHDFNNILSSIIGYTEIAIARTHQAPVIDLLEKVIRSSERARDLVDQILAFSRKSDQEMRPLHIQSIISESLKLIRASLPTTLSIHQDIQTEPIVVQANSTQIHQVLMNLLTNAAHAVGNTPGTIEVQAMQVDLTAADAAIYPGLRPGAHVQISVRDTGSGIDPDIMDKIFDPYFTTKDKGKGTGLGLAVVQAIVKTHHGMIRVESVPGKGSTFYICLPCSSKSTTDFAAVEDSNLPTGTERILVVDDEPNIVEIVQSTLEYLGYRVEACTSSRKAFEWFQEAPDRFDLMITDMTMPEMTGDALARKILAMAPDKPIILCTGYSDQITAQKAFAMGIRKFLLKPISLRSLAQCVRDALDNPTTEKPI